MRARTVTRPLMIAGLSAGLMLGGPNFRDEGEPILHQKKFIESLEQVEDPLRDCETMSKGILNGFVIVERGSKDTLISVTDIASGNKAGTQEAACAAVHDPYNQAQITGYVAIGTQFSVECAETSAGSLDGRVLGAGGDSPYSTIDLSVNAMMQLSNAGLTECFNGSAHALLPIPMQQLQRGHAANAQPGAI